MYDFIKMTERGPVVDFDGIRAYLDVGVRRAALFADLGTRRLEGDPPTSASLAPLVRFQLIPEALNDDEIKRFKDEYCTWILANALMELDSYWHRFLDKLWYALELGKHGNFLPDGFEPSSIHKGTNSHAKLQKIAERLDLKDDDLSHFRTISNARNVLAHHAGIVPSEKAHHNNTLLVSWSRIDSSIVSADGSITPFPGAEPVVVFGESKMMIQLVVAERIFAVGQRIELSSEEVAQICMMFQMFGGQLWGYVLEKLRSSGVEFVGSKE